MRTRKQKFLTWFAESAAVSIAAHLAAWLVMPSDAGAIRFLGHIAGVAAVNVLVYGL
jgi:hypothetical protein